MMITMTNGIKWPSMGGLKLPVFVAPNGHPWPRSDCAWCGEHAQCHGAHGAGRGVEHGNAQVGEGAPKW